MKYTTDSFKNETKKQRKKVGKMCEQIVFDYSKLKGRIVEKYGTQRNFALANKITDRSMSLKRKRKIASTCSKSSNVR